MSKEIKLYGYKLEFPFALRIDRAKETQRLTIDVCCNPTDEINDGNILLCQQGKMNVESFIEEHAAKGDFFGISFNPVVRRYNISMLPNL